MFKQNTFSASIQSDEYTQHVDKVLKLLDASMLMLWGGKNPTWHETSSQGVYVG